LKPPTTTHSTGGFSPALLCRIDGRKSARHNNLFGWDSGRAHFPNPIAGIHTVGITSPIRIYTRTRLSTSSWLLIIQTSSTVGRSNPS
jgi:hypothetical protein